jgi:hypothetical protein
MNANCSGAAECIVVGETCSPVDPGVNCTNAGACRVEFAATSQDLNVDCTGAGSCRVRFRGPGACNVKCSTSNCFVSLNCALTCAVGARVNIPDPFGLQPGDYVASCR